MKKKACKRCRMFVDGAECPSCKGNQFTNNWKGRLFVLDATESGISKRVGLNINGEYAIKVR